MPAPTGQLRELPMSDKMMHQGQHMESAFVLASCLLQTITNFVILYVYASKKVLRRAQTLILLVSLAFIDFWYAIAQMVYITSRFSICGTEEDTESTILILGGIPAALMKSGATIVTAIAIDRTLALYFPLTYYNLNRRCWLGLVFLFSLALAAVDFALIQVLQDGVQPIGAEHCCAFTCSISASYKKYWGISNMIVNIFPVFFTILVMIKLRQRSRYLEARIARIESEHKNKIDEGANRASLYILLISILVGVFPGLFNGISDMVGVDQPYFVELIVSACATLSGLSHAFVFGLAHTQVRLEIANLCLQKDADEKRPPTDEAGSKQVLGVPEMVLPYCTPVERLDELQRRESTV